MSFLEIGSSVDEGLYFRQIIEDLEAKSDQQPYAERRAFEMNDCEEIDYEQEIALAMEDIGMKEKDLS